MESTSGEPCVFLKEIRRGEFVYFTTKNAPFQLVVRFCLEMAA